MLNHVLQPKSEEPTFAPAEDPPQDLQARCYVFADALQSSVGVREVDTGCLRVF